MGKENIEIIVGTHEEFVLGYELIPRKDGGIQLQQSFADHSHMGSVRQVAVSGKFLVSGATDEVIKIFNLNARTDVGTISNHTGTITHLSFHESKYLFSAAEDGKICIFSRGKWQCDKTLLGHKGVVRSVSVHPSGKLALSVGQDATLHTWNLIKGRKAYITNIKTAADKVQWSPSGTSYLLVRGNCVEVYQVATAQLVHSIDFKQQLSALAFITEELIAVGGEGCNICLYDIGGGGTEMLQWEAHKLRVKCLVVLPEASHTQDHVHLVSASSDGTIKIWSLDLLSLTSPPKVLAEVNTSCRIICMDVYFPPNKPTSATPLPNTEEVPSSGGEEEDEDAEEGEDEDENIQDEDEEVEDEEEEEEAVDEQVEKEQNDDQEREDSEEEIVDTEEEDEPVKRMPRIENSSTTEAKKNLKRKKKYKKLKNYVTGNMDTMSSTKKKKLV